MYPVCFVEKFRFFIYSGIIYFQKICISSYPFSMFLIILYFNLYSEALHTHRFRLTDTYVPRTPFPSQIHRPCLLFSSKMTQPPSFDRFITNPSSMTSALCEPFLIPGGEASCSYLFQSSLSADSLLVVALAIPRHSSPSSLPFGQCSQCHQKRGKSFHVGFFLELYIDYPISLSHPQHIPSPLLLSCFPFPLYVWTVSKSCATHPLLFPSITLARLDFAILSDLPALQKLQKFLFSPVSFSVACGLPDLPQQHLLLPPAVPGAHSLSLHTPWPCLTGTGSRQGLLSAGGSCW